MTILIRRARIVDPRSPFHLQTRDIFIRQGQIAIIGEDIRESSDERIDIPGLHVYPGWVDIFSQGGDPGFEQRETLETLSMAAAAGGYTHVLVLPNTQPVVQHKSLVDYIRDKHVPAPVTLHPVGAVSKQAEGRELAEMYDMQKSGAIAFSDGNKPVQSAGLLIKALQYVKAFDGVIIQVPDDQSVAPHGLMHEGLVSTRMGLPGKPALAEELMIARDIKLTRYTDSALHFTGVSTAKSLEYIRRAREGGIRITASTSPLHLCYTDQDLEGYDTNLKVNPPLRTEADRQALLQALQDGTLDCLASHHTPLDKDCKICEFEYAKFGSIGLETTAGVLGKLGVPAERLAEILSIAPRRIFRLPEAVIRENADADMTLFLPGESYIFTEERIRSRSSNSPFIGQSLKGIVAGTIHRQKISLQHA